MKKEERKSIKFTLTRDEVVEILRAHCMKEHGGIMAAATCGVGFLDEEGDDKETEWPITTATVLFVSEV